MGTEIVTDNITEGNGLFVREEVVNEYRRELEKYLEYTFYRLKSDPDLAEGKGYREGYYVGVPKGATTNTLLHYLTERFGKPLSFIMGVEPVDTWKIETELHFKDVEHMLRILKYKEVIGRAWNPAEREREIVILNSKGEAEPSIFSK